MMDHKIKQLLSTLKELIDQIDTPELTAVYNQKANALDFYWGDQTFTASPHRIPLTEVGVIKLNYRDGRIAVTTASR